MIKEIIIKQLVGFGIDMGVKKNFSYNLLLTLCGYIFPLITYPYVSRVLGVQNIGICNFVDSIINYFVLFSMLGIGSYGVREIARVSKDLNRRNFVFSNLLAINLITTVVSILILTLCSYAIPKLIVYRPYLLIGIVKLFFNMFLIEWFYQGIQDFRYITIRSLVVRIVYVVSIFIFIHDSEDVLMYFFLTTLTTIINAVINWIHARNFIKLSFKGLEFSTFIVPILTFGYYRILTSMYTTFNTVFLGLTSGDIEVGYFSTATKIYTIIMSIFAAFTTVMIPKVSKLLNEGQIEKLQWISDKTLSIVSVFSIPIIIYCLFCAEDIIILISGPGYEGAITPFRIVIFMLLVIGAEQILIQQFLMASTENKPILVVSSLGAVVGVGLNFLLTPSYGSVGSAIAWGMSEICVLFLGILFVKKNLGVIVSLREIVIDLLWALLYVIPLYGIYLLHLEMWMNLAVSSMVTIVIFSIINLKLHKNQLLFDVLSGLKNKLLK